jgi:hypothetical protein
MLKLAFQSQMIRWISFNLALLYCLFTFGPAYAQSDPTLTRLSIQIWPEFDRPETLIIYQAELASDVNLPTTLVFQLPSGIETMNAVAVADETGNLVNHPYELTTVESQNRLTLTVEQPAFQFEYYDPTVLVKDGDQRQLTFSAVTDYAVDNLLIEVQQQFGADSMELIPAPTGTTQGRDELTYHSIVQSGQPAGASLNVVGSYQKPFDTLTMNAAPGTGNTPNLDPISAPTQTAPQPGMTIGYILVGLGALILLFSGTMWVVNRRKQQPVTAGRYQPASRKKARTKSTSAHIATESSQFCHKCGAAFKDQAAFCHNCGTRRR